MTCELCPRSLAKLAELAEIDPESLRAKAKLCDACSQRSRMLLASLAALRSAEPEGNDRVRESNVAAAIRRAAQRAPARENKRPLLFPALAFALASAAAVVLVLRFWPAKDASAVRVIDGELYAEASLLPKGTALPSDMPLVVRKGVADIRLSDGSEIEAREGCVFRAVPTKARFKIEAGKLSFRVRHRPVDLPLIVETPEADVRVVGTQFTVARAPGHTEVSVTEGVVEVTSHRTGAVRKVSAGESMDVDADQPIVPVADSGPPEGGPTLDFEPTVEDVRDAGAEREGGGPRDPRTVRPSDVRARLRAGKVSEARALLGVVRRSSHVTPAEIGVLEAEILLAEGRHDAAIEAYLRVSRDFPKSAQAEETLFAAAQLTMDRGGRVRGRQLLQDYVRRYPKGRFLNEADRLLDVTSTPPP